MYRFGIFHYLSTQDARADKSRPRCVALLMLADAPEFSG